MALDPTDLTASARIREAALDLFAANGVEATSVRDVARAAGVSPGLVQHYFPSKEALREAVGTRVVETIADAFEQRFGTGLHVPTAEEIGRLITDVFRDHPTSLVYAARGAADADDHALALFDALVDLARTQIRRIADAGLMRPDVDDEWAALQIVVYVLGMALFEDAVNRHLPSSYLSGSGLERFHDASTALFAHGVFAAPQSRRA